MAGSVRTTGVQPLPVGFTRQKAYWPAVTIALLIASLCLVLSQAVFPPGGPVPDSPSYTQQAIEMSHGNFVSIPWVGEVGQDPADRSGMFPSRYPPGYSFALMPFAAIAPHGEDGVAYGNAFLVWLLVVAAVACAILLGGWTAGLVALLILMTSTFIWSSAEDILSDAFGALLAVLGLLCVIGLAKAQTRRGAMCWALGLGAACGYAITTRFVLGLLLVAALIVVPWRAKWLTIIAAAPFVLALGVYQWVVFGSPLKTGYDYWLPGLAPFQIGSAFRWDLPGDSIYIHAERLNGALLSWLGLGDGPAQAVIGHTPPLITYPAVLLGLYWVFLPPFVALAGLAWLWYSRSSTSARFIALAAAFNVLVFLPYTFMGARFIAPAAVLLIVATSAGFAEVTRRLAPVFGQRSQPALVARGPADPECGPQGH